MKDSDKRELSSVIDNLCSQDVICPLPNEWTYCYFEICDGKNESQDNPSFEGYALLILSGWHDNEHNQAYNFYNSIVYFYQKYPTKRPLIINFLNENNKWLKRTYFDLVSLVNVIKNQKYIN